MSQIKSIRKKLGLTQAELAVGLGCTQPNIGHYEADRQMMPPSVAKRLIAFAATLGHTVTYDDVYGVVVTPAQDAASV